MKNKIIAIMMISLMMTTACSKTEVKSTEAKTETKAVTKETTKEEKTSEVKIEKSNSSMTEDVSNASSSSNAGSNTASNTVKEENSTLGEYIKSAAYVKANLKNKDIIFIDARDRKEIMKTGTIEGAVVMTWQQIADMDGKKPGDEGWGHILSPELLSQKLSELGLDMNKEIILFSNGKAGWGEDGRILWELKAAGYKKLSMVDGGIDSIIKEGIEVTRTISEPVKAEVKVEKIDYKNTIDTKELTADYDKYKIIDSREKDEYDGAQKFGEAKGGHLKGAVNIPYSSLYDENGMLKSKEELAKIFEDAGFKKDDKVVTYCTGGIRSAYMQLVMEMLGYTEVKNYQGSFYNWAKINPVEK